MLASNASMPRIPGRVSNNNDEYFFNSLMLTGRLGRLLATEIEGVIGSDTLDEFLGGAEGVCQHLRHS